MKPITGETREDAWLQAMRHLYDLDDHIEYNLILEIKKPTGSDEKSKIIRDSLDGLLKCSSDNLYPIHTVADTIFPSAEYKKHKLKGITEIYPNEIFPQIQSAPGNTHGTYAQRIVRGFDSKGKPTRPLDNLLKRLKSQLEHQKVRCAFELSLDDTEVIPIYRNDNLIRGFPCLSHLSFKLSKDRDSLHLTALYRSHDYVQKALGNLLGLARLQKCVAKELNIQVGTLVCHSTYARLDTHTGIGKRKLEEFINKMEDL